MTDTEGGETSTDCETGPNPIDLFVRTASGDFEARSRVSALSFHEFCAIHPGERFYREENTGQSLQIVPEGIRLVLRYWPVVMACLTLAYALIPLVEGGVQPVWVYLPPIGPRHLPLLGGVAVLWAALAGIIMHVGLFDGYDEFLKPVLVYGLAGVHLAGVLFSVFLVWTADDPSALPANVVFGSGFLFAAFVGGMIAYDLLNRTENLLEHFHEKNIVVDERNYRDLFHRDLRGRLTADWYGVPVAYVFGSLFTLQLAVFWAAMDGPHHLGSVVALAANVFFDVILLAAVLQFLVLSRHITELLHDSYEKDGRRVRIDLRPFHPDTYGGFRDVGRAAMQINFLIILAGLYYAYRLFVQGSRALPSDGFGAFTELEGLVWLVDFAGPMLVYALVAGTWLYSAFWAIHLKMSRDKERQILDRQYETRSRATDGPEPPIGGPEDKQGFEDLLDAPVWPIDNRQLQTLVLTNAIPLFLTVSSLPI